MRDSDFSLIQAVLAGNAEAFGALVTRYQKGVYMIPMAARNKACGCGCGLQRKAKGRKKRSKTAKSAR